LHAVFSKNLMRMGKSCKKEKSHAPESEANIVSRSEGSLPLKHKMKFDPAAQLLRPLLLYCDLKATHVGEDGQESHPDKPYCRIVNMLLCRARCLHTVTHVSQELQCWLHPFVREGPCGPACEQVSQLHMLTLLITIDVVEVALVGVGVDPHLCAVVLLRLLWGPPRKVGRQAAGCNC
jgi:hypothetical protein